MMNIATWTMIGNDFRTMFADVSYTFIDECILILKLIKDKLINLSFVFFFVCLFQTSFCTKPCLQFRRRYTSP